MEGSCLNLFLWLLPCCFRIRNLHFSLYHQRYHWNHSFEPFVACFGVVSFNLGRTISCSIITCSTAIIKARFLLTYFTTSTKPNPKIGSVSFVAVRTIAIGSSTSINTSDMIPTTWHWKFLVANCSIVMAWFRCSKNYSMGSAVVVVIIEIGIICLGNCCWIIGCMGSENSATTKDSVIGINFFVSATKGFTKVNVAIVIVVGGINNHNSYSCFVI